ncbi:hypothetical protein EJ04DRAFT_572840 [Polyplosphaeria fusca]|uniref:Uncharacterized protein n=1 Tax=Polyplosphaeria fusca TaxID=682080 RepID=A0A9P4RA64_9PLEO|nr:hypothetical protein EJ04DRAFT_572840 [Polyplosphaeria fusca]
MDENRTSRLGSNTPRPAELPQLLSGYPPQPAPYPGSSIPGFRQAMAAHMASLQRSRDAEARSAAGRPLSDPKSPLPGKETSNPAFTRYMDRYGSWTSGYPPPPDVYTWPETQLSNFGHSITVDHLLPERSIPSVQAQQSSTRRSAPTPQDSGTTCFPDIRRPKEDTLRMNRTFLEPCHGEYPRSVLYPSGMTRSGPDDGSVSIEKLERLKSRFSTGSSGPSSSGATKKAVQQTVDVEQRPVLIEPLAATDNHELYDTDTSLRTRAPPISPTSPPAYAAIPPPKLADTTILRCESENGSFGMPEIHHTLGLPGYDENVDYPMCICNQVGYPCKNCPYAMVPPLETAAPTRKPLPYLVDVKENMASQQISLQEKNEGESKATNEAENKATNEAESKAKNEAESKAKNEVESKDSKKIDETADDDWTEVQPSDSEEPWKILSKRDWEGPVQLYP